MPTYGQAASSGNSQIQTRLNVSYSDNDPVNGNSNVTVTIQYRRTSTASTTYYASAPYTITIGSTDQGTISTPTSSGTADFDVRGFTANTWYNYASYTAAVHGGQAITISGTITLTGTSAVKCSSSGTIPQLTIKFNGNGNTGGSMSSYTITSGISKKIPYNQFTKTGHSFVGWRMHDETEDTWRGYDNSETATVGYYAASEITEYYVYGDYTSTSGRNNNHTLCLYAQWKANTYTITYNASGGTGTAQTQTVTYGGTVTTKAGSIFSRTGYTFLNWYIKGADIPAGGTDPVGTDLGIAASTTITYRWAASLTFYAAWKANSYTVTYKANGGTGSNVTQTVTYNSSWTSKGSSTFTKTGYSIDSWNTKSDGSGTKYSVNTATTMITASNITLYAQWKANTYTITYNANGGEGSNVTQSVTYDSSWTTKGEIFTRAGYTLVGWHSGSSTSATVFPLNNTSTWQSTYGLMLYASWAKNYNAAVYTDDAWQIGQLYFYTNGNWELLEFNNYTNGAWVQTKLHE